MLTEEQSQYFDSVFKSKMQNSTLTFVWEKPTKDESEMKQWIISEADDDTVLLNHYPDIFKSHI